MITSRANPKIKQLLQLQKPRERRAQGIVVIEGMRELRRAAASGWSFSELYLCDDLVKLADRNFAEELASQCRTERISREVFEHIAYRENSDGILALAKEPKLSLSTLSPGDNPLILVLEAVEKPGNLGAIMRTADAAGVNAVLVCDPATDLFNPNAIRSSVGCIFTVPVRACTSEEALRWLKSKNIAINATSLIASQNYLDTDFTKPTAIVMGTEADGLTQFWTQHSDNRIRIEMQGIADSLNVSVAAAIVTFEAIRQRRGKK
ncbi:MAG: RNA methyltransferase [Bacteroidia bacterium]|jgi:TrmH family RNA methyltransferase|nr:RNA methyltransferase [Bacteroidia bacterium]